ncbi:MAG: hypothetical protein ABW044_11750 [Cellvibrio sp.]
MDTLEKAIEAAYSDELTILYRTLSKALLTTKDDQAAQEKFKKGLAHALKVRNLARASAGL